MKNLLCQYALHGLKNIMKLFSLSVTKAQCAGSSNAYSPRNSRFTFSDDWGTMIEGPQPCCSNPDLNGIQMPFFETLKPLLKSLGVKTTITIPSFNTRVALIQSGSFYLLYRCLTTY